jgi:PAS domain S-box-containing protein
MYGPILNSISSEEFMPIEQQFKAMVDKAPVMIWISGIDKQCDFFNQGWLDFTGRSLQMEIGQGWSEGVHPDDIEKSLKIYHKAFDARKEFKMEYRLKRHDGEYRWILDHGVPRYSAGGQFVGYVGSCIDISEIKELENKKSEFISAASHELKTPVTTLKVYMHLLREHLSQLKDKAPLSYVEKATDQLAKLTKLINELLDLSRIEVNRMECNYSVFHYGSLIEQLSESCAEFNKTHKIDIKGDSGVFVRADKDLLTQAIINLIDNAIKFSREADKVVLEISIDKNQIKTVVTDFGIGIHKRHHKRIFDRFYRIREAQKQTYPGLGVGLFLTSEIIKRHGGKIWVESEENKQTNFIFTIPVYSEK